jgi:hypothetical protein
MVTRRANHPMKSMIDRRAAVRALGALALSAVVGATAVVPAAIPAAAQDRNYGRLVREGYALSRGEADALEAELARNPEDAAARTRLLGFYFRAAPGAVARDEAIAARRRHILWLIKHHPGSEALDLSETTIDREGHSLADPVGHEQAAALWIEQAARHDKSAAVLGHAAAFFLLSDKPRAVAFLRRAHQAEPGNREWSARIGYALALAILGVDMKNQNGLPTRHNPVEARSELASRAAVELKASTDVVMVAVAGSIIGQYGLILSAICCGPEKFAVDFVPLAEALLTRAQELDPSNPAYARELEQFRKLRAGQAK